MLLSRIRNALIKGLGENEGLASQLNMDCWATQCCRPTVLCFRITCFSLARADVKAAAVSCGQAKRAWRAGSRLRLDCHILHLRM
jgi:hypothetical protein